MTSQSSGVQGRVPLLVVGETEQASDMVEEGEGEEEDGEDRIGGASQSGGSGAQQLLIAWQGRMAEQDTRHCRWIWERG